MHICSNCNKKASLTVEISLLMPLMISVLILTIFLAYYLHDRCIIYSSINKSIVKTSEYYMYDDFLMIHSVDDSHIEDMIDIIFQEECAKRLIGKWDISKTVYVNDDYISVLIDGKMKCLAGMVFRYISDSFFAIRIEQKMTRIYEPEYIRKHIE